MALWGNKDSKTATGTITITGSTGAVVGVSTLFTTEAKLGNTIRVSGEDYQIVAIASDTACTVRSGITGATMTDRSGVSYTLSEKPASARISSANDSGLSNVFGVDNTELSAGGDNVTAIGVAVAGTRYLEVPAVTFSGGGGSSAAATAVIAGGAVTGVTITNVGSAYTSAPTVAIAKPKRNIPVANFTTATDTITYTAHGLVAGEEVKYFHGGGTAPTGLTNNTSYFVANAGRTANAFEVKAANTVGTILAPVISGTGGAGTFTCTATTLTVGDRVTITGTNTGTGSITGYTAPGPATYKISVTNGTTSFTLQTEAGVAIATSIVNAATFTGLTFSVETVIDIQTQGAGAAQYFEIQNAADQATATAALGSGNSGIKATHAGWVKRTVGTGGRAGRVQTEVLVAMGSITGDQVDDIQYPDA